MRRNHTLLEMLHELQSLDRVPRSGYSLRGIAEPESVSEHTFHVAFLAWSLAVEEPELDRLRILELALVHDLAEVRTGDLPRTAAGYLPAGAKAQSEMAATRDLLAPLGEHPAKLLAEYQAGETPEARFVAVCDKLQLLIKASAYRRWGARGMGEFFDNLKGFANGGFDVIARVLRDLENQPESSDRTLA